MCGEYGEKLDRPHYHAMLFGCDFNDRVFYKTNKNGDKVDTSKLLDETWQLGFCTVGDVTQQSARYVAGYVTKKISGEPKDDWYMGRVPEYGRGSNGIGLDYLVKFGSQWMNTDLLLLMVLSIVFRVIMMRSIRRLTVCILTLVKDERILDARGRPVDPNKDCRSFNRYKAVDTSKRAKLKLARRDYET